MADPISTKNSVSRFKRDKTLQNVEFKLELHSYKSEILPRSILLNT